MTTSNTSFIQEIRGLPRTVWIMAAGTFVDRFGTFVVPFLLLFLTNHGMKEEIAGLAIGLNGFGGLCAAGLGGYLSDRIGRRHTMALSMAGGACTSLLLYAAVVYHEELGGFHLTFLCAYALGLIRGMYHAASSSLVADLVPKEKRVAGFAFLRFAINLGWAMGMTTAGLIAKAGLSFFWLFAIDASTSIVLGLVALFFLPHGVRSSRSESGWSHALKSIRSNHRFIAVCLNALAIGVIYTQLSSSYAFYLRDMLKLPNYEEVFFLIMAINGFLIAIFEIPISAMIRHYPAPRMIALGTFIAAVGFGLMFLLPGFGGMAVGMAVFTLGEMISLPMQGAYVSILAPEQMRGRYNGTIGLMWASSHMFAPVLGIWLLGIHPLLLCGFVVALGAVAATTLVRHRVPDSESSEAVASDNG